MDPLEGKKKGALHSSPNHWLACSPRVAVPDAADSMWFFEEELKGVEDPGRAVDAARWEATHSPEDYAARFEALPADRARGEKCADLLAWLFRP